MSKRKSANSFLGNPQRDPVGSRSEVSQSMTLLLSSLLAREAAAELNSI